TRAIPAEADQPRVLMAVQAVDRVIEAALAVFATAPREERAVDAGRPVLFFKGTQDQMLIRGPLGKAFDKSSAKPQFSEVMIIVRPEDVGCVAGSPATAFSAHGVGNPFYWRLRRGCLEDAIPSVSRTRRGRSAGPGCSARRSVVRPSFAEFFRNGDGWETRSSKSSCLRAPC